jgi:hypothetical protein
MARSKLPKRENGLDILNDIDIYQVVIAKIALVMIVDESTLQGREVHCNYKTGNEETWENLDIISQSTDVHKCMKVHHT